MSYRSGGGSHDFFGGSGGGSRRAGPSSATQQNTATHDATIASSSSSSNKFSLLSRPRDDERERDREKERDRHSQSQTHRKIRDLGHGVRDRQIGPLMTTRPSSRNGSSSSRPVGSTTTSTTTTPTILKNDNKEMVDAKKLIGDSMTFEDFIGEFLTDNQNFSVIGAIGPQGAGKSTILSMLGGNDTQDKYRHYVFRPASREAIESSRYQTVKIYAYVSKSRQILIDCQAVNCASMLEESIRHGHSRVSKVEDRLESEGYTESMQLVSFLLQICQTILVCCDWALDLELFKLIRTAEMLRANVEHIPYVPSINPLRKVNLVFLHTRAKSFDFSTLVRSHRANLIRAMFVDSPRIRVADNDDYVIVPLADLKPRKDTVTMMHGAATAERLLDTECVEVFDVSIGQLRNRLAALPRDGYSVEGISEKQWLVLARSIWRDPSFLSSITHFNNISGGRPTAKHLEFLSESGPGYRMGLKQ